MFLFFLVLEILLSTGSSLLSSISLPVQQDIKVVVQVPTRGYFIKAYSNGTMVILDESFSQQNETQPCNLTLKSIDPFPAADCFVVGCQESVKIFCFDGPESNFSFSLIEEIENTNYNISASPFKVFMMNTYMDIHQSNREYLSCDIRGIESSDNMTNFTGRCQQITISHGYSLLFTTISTALISAKAHILPGINLTQIFIFSPDRPVFEVRLYETVVYMTASATTLYVRTQKHELFSYIYDVSTEFTQVPEIRNIGSLHVVEDELYYTKIRLEVYNLVNNSITTVSNNMCDKMWGYGSGFFCYRNSTFFDWYRSNSSANYSYPNVTNTTQQLQPVYDSPIMFDSQPEPEPEIVVSSVMVFYDCGEGCSICKNETYCSSCQSGYIEKDGKCHESQIFSLASSSFSFPYSVFALKMILVDFVEEFWFYEYHDTNYTISSEIFQFVGGVNRNKFMPIFVKVFLGQAYEDFNEKKSRIYKGKGKFTQVKFLEKEREPTVYLMNTSKMFIWAYLIAAVIYLIHRFLAIMTSRCPMITKKFQNTRVVAILLFIFIDAHIQFVTFMFFEQFKIPFQQQFKDKLNLIGALLFLFMSIFFTFSAFFLLKKAYSKKKKNLAILYPQIKTDSNFSYLYVLCTGPGRKFLLGFIQSMYSNYQLQMILLVFMNFITICIMSKSNKIVTQKNRNRRKILFYFCAMTFGVFSLFRDAGMFFSHVLYSELQFVMICGMWTICLFQFSSSILTFIMELMVCQQKDVSVETKCEQIKSNPSFVVKKSKNFIQF